MSLGYVIALLASIALTGAIWLGDAAASLFARLRSGVRTSPAGRARTIFVEHARSLFPVLVLIFGVRTALAEPFHIPSGSMMPTLEVGDYIVVDKFSYGVRLPLLDTKILDVGEPRRGDIAVFRPPWAPREYWIKRVVGLPGDEITYRDKRLFINGNEIVESAAATYTGAPEPDRDTSGAEVRIEQLDGVAHPIMQWPSQRNGREGTWRVPAGHYFMMGDSRDNSMDSRYLGFVPEQNLVGRARAIWMSWAGGIDVARIGTVLK